MRIRSLAVGVAVLAMAALGLTACNPARTYTYRIATRGHIVADVNQFASHVQSTLDDPRGWSLGGSIRFVRTEGPANFTIWLAAANTLPSFGPPCSSMWSCRQGGNVIINQDRWLGASPSWPYGVDTYQHYVVNHEVGHWMGFGHASCPAPWQPAPVMVQQSKGGAAMGRCRFNVWPTGGELGGAGSRHGVPVWPTGLPSPDDPFGSLEMLTVRRDAEGKPVEVDVSGWILDGDTSAPITVAILANGKLIGMTPAADERLDVGAAHPRYGPDHGFRVAVPIPTDTLGVCVAAVGTGSGVGMNTIGCRPTK